MSHPIPSFVQVHGLLEAKARRRLQIDRALLDLAFCHFVDVMYYICSSVMDLIVLVSFDSSCIIIMTYDLGRLCTLNLNLCCTSVLY